VSDNSSMVKPVTNKDRFLTLDIIRGVALFGILLINITAFGLPYAYQDPTIYGGAEGYDLWSWISTEMLFEGTQRGIFSILFGAGIILLTSRLEKSGIANSQDIYFRRNVWLMLFGVIHAYILLWSGEILFAYGLFALIAYVFRHLSPKNLFIIAIAFLLFGAVLDGLKKNRINDNYLKYTAAIELKNDNVILTKEQSEDIEAWEEIEKDMKPDEAKIQKKIDGILGSYTEHFIHNVPASVYMQSSHIYRYFYDLISMILIGMALFKLGVMTLQAKTRLYLGMMLGGYAVGLTTNYYEVTTLISSEFSIQAFNQTSDTYWLGRLGMTVGHLGLLLLFCKSGIFSWLQKSLAAVGQMALTNYVSHSIICGIVFYGIGFGLFAQLARHELYYVVFSIWIAQLIISPIWLKYYKFGPLEWLWRSLTYMKRQPMKKEAV